MNPNGVIMEPGVIVVGVASLDGTKNLRFRVRATDTMKKLIETYSKMESVIPAAIQLIYKGNPVNETDTPINLNLSSDDVPEVCRVPGIPLNLPSIKDEPDVKKEKGPSPDLIRTESSPDLLTPKNEVSDLMQ